MKNIPPLTPELIAAAKAMARQDATLTGAQANALRDFAFAVISVPEASAGAVFVLGAALTQAEADTRRLDRLQYMASRVLGWRVSWDEKGQPAYQLKQCAGGYDTPRAAIDADCFPEGGGLGQ